MKILLINDPGISVPPKLYGGIERIVYDLAEEYINQGHSVTLLAGPESKFSGTTIHFGKNGFNRSKIQLFKEVLFVWKFLLFNQQKYDAIHSFGRLIYLLPILNKPIKKVMSYQREVTVKNIQFISKLPQRNLLFTGCSDYISKKSGLGRNWRTVCNSVNLNKYQANHNVPSTSPFVFLGRLDRIKGCHYCIALAKELNHPLTIAGNISELQHEKQYFEDEIKPHIDGTLIRYVGPVNDDQKNKLLGNSLALLMLIEWDEPFGIVMAEAMACGTPILAFNRGSVPEVVHDGLNGYRADGYEELVHKAQGLHTIDRKKVREYCESNFAISTIAKKFLTLLQTANLER